MTTLLQVKNLKKSYNKQMALDQVGFSIRQGECVGLIGKSGSGKSTLCKVILGLTMPDDGDVLWRGKSIYTNKAARKQMRQEVQVIFQNPSSSLNPRWPVSKIIMEPLKNRSKEVPPFLRVVRHSEKAMAGRLLEMVGLHPSLSNRSPQQLSGGQKQRVAIARAISVQPTLIICDEPTASLDLSVQSQILQLLKHLQEQYQISYLFISHRLESVYWISDRILTLNEGRLVDSFPASGLWDFRETL